MSATISTPASHVTRAVDFIDASLSGDLRLQDIAAAVNLSPYHFGRLFAAVMGESPMAYVRRRRLAKAALRLMNDPETSLIDLAFECGFESQEAFTRAFRRTLGLTPGELRRGHSSTPADEPPQTMMPATLGEHLTADPHPRRLAALCIAGLCGRFDRISRAAIPSLWKRLVEHPSQPLCTPVASYGVCRLINPSEGSFSYMAGVAVAEDAKLPAEFRAQRIPEQTYRVFRHTLDGSDLHLQIVRAIEEIWSQRLPAMGVDVVAGPDFERYPPGLPTRSSRIDRILDSGRPLKECSCDTSMSFTGARSSSSCWPATPACRPLAWTSCRRATREIHPFVSRCGYRTLPAIRTRRSERPFRSSLSLMASDQSATAGVARDRLPAG
ncbi:MAG TPA: AraC family transcriptional regulator [Steroidobacteraceae bacterium]|jgi:AraC family transcriptional regulator|nr:AraC family transcriptional regulator [Steroidobacteraceae bacterium]